MAPTWPVLTERAGVSAIENEFNGRNGRICSFGRLDKALDAAALNKWTGVDMKRPRVFAFE